MPNKNQKALMKHIQKAAIIHIADRNDLKRFMLDIQDILDRHWQQIMEDEMRENYYIVDKYGEEIDPADIITEVDKKSGYKWAKYLRG